MSFGKSVHLSRLVGDGMPFIVPMDHGLTSGPEVGIERPADISRLAAGFAGHATGLVVHGGMAKFLDPLTSPPLILQTMGMPESEAKSRTKQPVVNVDRAIRLAADGVAVQIDFGANVSESIRHSAEIIAAADRWDLPVLVMVSGSDWSDGRSLEKAIRWAIELGADLVKVDPGNLRSRDPVDARSADVPVLMAGGGDPAHLREAIDWAARSGFAGLCIGRGVFGSPDPLKAMQDLKVAFSNACEAPK